MTKTLQDTSKDIKNLLQTLQCQFLSCYPVSSIQWEEIPWNLTWEQQEIILKSTYGHELNKLYPIKLDYQLNFLKQLIKIFERNSGAEVLDDVYNEYCKLQQAASNSENVDGATELVYKHYLLPQFETHLTMREAKSFVSMGTTGLCTWQASLALAEFLLHNQAYVDQKNVLELGAGTGLCGMILMRCNTTKVVALTDGSKECVELMRTNVQTNFPNANEMPDGFFEIETGEKYLGSFYLPWENVEEFSFTKKLKPDLILAADVIYDESLFKDLLHAIEYIFKQAEKNVIMLLAATVRNEETLEEFLAQAAPSLEIKECATVPESERCLQWDRTSIVRIFEIKPK